MAVRITYSNLIIDIINSMVIVISTYLFNNKTLLSVCIFKLFLAIVRALFFFCHLLYGFFFCFSVNKRVMSHSHHILHTVLTVQLVCRLCGCIFCFLVYLSDAEFSHLQQRSKPFFIWMLSYVCLKLAVALLFWCACLTLF